MVSTLPQTLQQSAQAFPNRGISYIQDSGTHTFQSYPQLLEEASKIRAGLRQLGLQAGDKVILALSDKQQFISAFWGCLLGGIIPAPLPAPTSLYKANPKLEKLHNVWQVLDCPLVLLDAKLLTPHSEKPKIANIPANKLLTLDALNGEQSATDFYNASFEDTAFIQFSSGSTGLPKGVILTHQNLLCNLRAIVDGVDTKEDDISLSWLPLYHDMGLIGFHLAPIYAGIDHFLLNPAKFIRRPLLWLDCLEKYCATITAAPNFSQALLLDVLERYPEKKWNLNRVRVIFNGAEPIAVDLMERFTAKMAGYGLSPEAMFPVYGLAEASLAVTFPPVSTVPKIETLQRQEFQTHHQAVPAKSQENNVIRFASVGLSVFGCEVRIVNDVDELITEGHVGHIQIRGENVTSGYYNNPVATEKAFYVNCWLRTGDLGFIRDGHLCVTGRAKDILFINGQNYYAHDLENIAQQVKGVQPGRVAVCGWHDEKEGKEKVLVFLACSDLAKSAQQFFQVKQQLQRELGLIVDVMIPIKSKQFPKTSSGKLQRYKLREYFEQGMFDEEIAQMRGLLTEVEKGSSQDKVAPGTPMEKLLHQLWCEELVLKANEIGIYDNFAELGGNSLQALTIVQRLEKNYSIQINSSTLAEYQTIAELANYIDKHPIAVHRSSQKQRKQIFTG